MKRKKQPIVSGKFLILVIQFHREVQRVAALGIHPGNDVLITLQDANDRLGIPADVVIYEKQVGGVGELHKELCQQHVPRLGDELTAAGLDAGIGDASRAKHVDGPKIRTEELQAHRVVQRWRGENNMTAGLRAPLG